MNDVKKKRALTILVSWLEATKTPHKILNDNPAIDVLIGDTPFQITDDAAIGLTGAIGSALPVFWEITERAGAGKPRPTFRPQFTGALLPHEDNDLVAMRHTEFRKVPNNPMVFLREDYQKIVSWAVSRFYRFNRVQLSRLGYETDDLRTFAWMYVMNFHGLWRDVHASDKKNGGSLCNYLQQRFFTDFRKLIDRKAQNVLVDTETVAMAMNFDIVPQWDRDDNQAGRRSQIAVSIEKTDDLHEEFEGLPVKIQMAKLVNFMQTRRGTEVKLEAEERLLGIGVQNLSPSAKKQIQKFHIEQLPEMTSEEMDAHTSGCSKCKLGA